MRAKPPGEAGCLNISKRQPSLHHGLADGEIVGMETTAIGLRERFVVDDFPGRLAARDVARLTPEGTPRVPEHRDDATA